MAWGDVTGPTTVWEDIRGNFLVTAIGDYLVTSIGDYLVKAEYETEWNGISQPTTVWSNV